MEDKTQQYKDIIEPLMYYASAYATSLDIPFIAVFQLNNDHFVLSHNVGKNAHKEMQQNIEWWTDYLDGKYDNKAIITDEDMQKANETVKEIAQSLTAQELIEKIRTMALCAIANGDAQGPVGFITGLGEIIDLCERQKDRNIAEIVQALDDSPYVRIEDEETGRIRAISESALKKLLSEPVTFTDAQKAQIADLAREQRLSASREASPRDTQFVGFARLLWEEMQSHAFINEFKDRRCVGPEYVEYMQRLIAQSIYDLVAQSADFVMDGAVLPKEAREEVSKYIMSRIPDMTEWPKEK
jgi:hypothetical protein